MTVVVVGSAVDEILLVDHPQAALGVLEVGMTQMPRSTPVSSTAEQILLIDTATGSWWMLMLLERSAATGARRFWYSRRTTGIGSSIRRIVPMDLIFANPDGTPKKPDSVLASNQSCFREPRLPLLSAPAT